MAVRISKEQRRVAKVLLKFQNAEAALKYLVKAYTGELLVQIEPHERWRVTLNKEGDMILEALRGETRTSTNPLINPYTSWYVVGAKLLKPKPPQHPWMPGNGRSWSWWQSATSNPPLAVHVLERLNIITTVE